MEAAIERAKKYIENLHAVMSTLELTSIPKDESRIIEYARDYLADAEFYLEKGDAVTSIACSSYAEGLLDALALLKKVKIEWPREARPRVLVGGAFEIIHPGHLHLLRRAKELGKVIVIVARDSTIQKLKGRPPIVPEHQRLEVVKSIRYVDEAYLGNDPLDIESTLLKLKPNIILLGPDQDYIEKIVKESLYNLNLNIKILKLQERIGDFNFSSSTIIRKLINLEQHQ